MLWFKWFSDLHFTSQNGGCHFKNLKISRNKLKQTKKRKKEKERLAGNFYAGGERKTLAFWFQTPIKSQNNPCKC